MNRSNTAKKRHCMVVHSYYPVGETRVQREALALRDQGYTVDVICLRDENEPANDSEDGITIFRLPVARHRDLGMAFQLIEYITFGILAFFKLMSLHRQRPYQTVQVHNLPDFLVFSAVGVKLMGANVILDLHDLMPEFFASKTGGRMDSLPVRLVILQEQLSCRFADRVITVTDVWKQTLIERGVAADKVSVVMNVADPRLFQRLEPALNPAGNGRNNAPVTFAGGNGAANGDGAGLGRGFSIVYHGTFTHRYGVDLIIQAIKQVQQHIPDVQANLLGGGDYRDELVLLRDELGLEECIYITPDLIHASQLPDLIRQADVGIVPNRSDIFTDGLLPTKLMEYVAIGTPVIAARTPTIESYFDNTMVQFFQAGNVDDLAHCIIELHNDRERLAQMRTRSDQFNQVYNWNNVAAGYVGMVDQLNSA